MAGERGKYVKLSLARRMIGDFLAASRSIPLAHGERRMKLGELREAVRQARPRPSWQAIFFKGWAIVSAKIPELRRCYVKYPWPRLYEHPSDVGCIVLTRPLEGDDALHFLPIRDPASRSLEYLDERFAVARRSPLEDITAFQRQVMLAKLPFFIRRPLFHLGQHLMPRMRIRAIGTYGMSCLASLDSSTLMTWTPWTTMIHYTPFDDDDSLLFRTLFDHRVIDGVILAKAGQELYETLNGPILEEVKSMRRKAAA